MNYFDQVYIGNFKYGKEHKWKYANSLAIFNVTMLQMACILIIGTLFAEFAYNMKLSTMSSSKAWTLFIVVYLIMMFLNWMSYSGKKRNQLRLKSKKGLSEYPSWLLWITPSMVMAMAILLTILLN